MKSKSKGVGKEKAEEGESKAKVTTDHSEIMSRVEERGGKPVRVKGTVKEGDLGVLRINFPGYTEEGLEELTWEEFFGKFEENNLAFSYQETTAGGKKSNICK